MRKWATTLLSILLLACIACGDWELYQRHLTSGVKRLLVAAADPQNSQPEVREYLRYAHMEVATNEDAEAVESFDSAFAMLVQAQALSHQRSRRASEKSALLRTEAQTRWNAVMREIGQPQRPGSELAEMFSPMR